MNGLRLVRGTAVLQQMECHINITRATDTVGIKLDEVLVKSVITRVVEDSSETGALIVER